MVGIVLIAFMLAKGVHRRRYMLESFGKIRAREPYAPAHLIFRRMIMKKINLTLAVLLITALLVPSLANQSTVTIDGQVKDIDALISEYKSKPWVTQINMYDTKLKPE